MKKLPFANRLSTILLGAAVTGAALAAHAAIVPVSPTDGEVIALVPDVQKKVMALPTLADRIALFREDREHGGKVIRHDKFWRKSRPVVMRWRVTEGETGPWKIEIGKTPDFENADIRYFKSDDDALTTKGTDISCIVPRANLEIARTYFWRVTGLGKPAEGQKKGPAVRSEVASFATEDLAPRWIEIEGKVGNIRDFGGRHTIDGHRIRQGMAFRGQGLNSNSVTGERQGRNRLTVEDVKYFTKTLGIKTDLDLRTKGETADLDESPLGPGVNFILRSSPAYKSIFTESNMKIMAENVRVFCNPDNYPIYFHCIAGADRTGSLAYVLMGFLGVDRHEIETDWESTFYPKIPDDIYENDPDYWCRESHFTDGFMKYGEEGDIWARRIELYLLDCGLTPEELARLRRIMLE